VKLIPSNYSALNSDPFVRCRHMVKNCYDVKQNIENFTSDTPSLNLNCEDYHLEGQGHGLSSVGCHYNLRSLSKKSVGSDEVMDPVGGLGAEVTKSISKKGRGRKSLLSKAQVKAVFDVADGKQMSITGALRAAKSPEAVKK